MISSLNQRQQQRHLQQQQQLVFSASSHLPAPTVTATSDVPSSWLLSQQQVKPPFPLIPHAYLNGNKLYSTVVGSMTSVGSDFIDLSTKIGVPLKQMNHSSRQQIQAMKYVPSLTSSSSYAADVRLLSNVNVYGNGGSSSPSSSSLTNGKHLHSSVGRPGSSSSSRSFLGNSRYKTELCRPFEEFGVCKYADKCQFAHGVEELRTVPRHPKYKTELCRTFHTTGFCPYGPRCNFIHNDTISQSPSPPPPPMTADSIPAPSLTQLFAARSTSTIISQQRILDYTGSCKSRGYLTNGYKPDQMRLDLLAISSLHGFLGSTGESSASGTISSCDTPSSVSPNSVHDDYSPLSLPPSIREQGIQFPGPYFNYPVTVNPTNPSSGSTREHNANDDDDNCGSFPLTFLPRCCMDDSGSSCCGQDLESWVANLDLGSDSDNSASSIMEEGPPVTFSVPSEYAANRLPIFSRISSDEKRSATWTR